MIDSKNSSLILTWSGLVFLFLVAVGVVFLSTLGLQRPQDIRQQASSSAQDKVIISLRTDVDRVEIGRTAFIDVLLNTEANEISGVDVIGGVTNVGESDLELSGAINDGLETILLTKKPVNSDVGFRMINFASIGKKQFFSTGGSEVKIGTLTITPRAEGEVRISLAESAILVTGLNPDTFDIEYGGDKIITVIKPGDGDDGKKSCNENCATDTECKTNLFCHQGNCRLPSDDKDEQCGSRPDLGINRSCDEYCADSSECSDEFSCYYNRCRNAENLDSESCSPPPSPVPAGTGVGGTGSGSRQVVTATIVGVDGLPIPADGLVATNIIIDAGESTGSSELASPSPSPTRRPSPSPKVSPTPEVIEPEGGGLSPFLTAFLITIAVGGILGFAYTRLRQRG